MMIFTAFAYVQFYTTLQGTKFNHGNHIARNIERALVGMIECQTCQFVLIYYYFQNLQYDPSLAFILICGMCKSLESPLMIKMNQQQQQIDVQFFVCLEFI